MICKECGAYNPDHATYCKVCAANLKGTPAPEAPETPEEEQPVKRFSRPTWVVPEQSAHLDDAVDQGEQIAEEVADKAEEQVRTVEENVEETVSESVPEEEPAMPMWTPTRARRSQYTHESEEPAETAETSEGTYTEENDGIYNEEEALEEEDDSFEYEPTPPKRKQQKKKGNSLFTVLLIAIIVVIIGILVAGGLFIAKKMGCFNKASESLKNNQEDNPVEQEPEDEPPQQLETPDPQQQPDEQPEPTETPSPLDVKNAQLQKYIDNNTDMVAITVVIPGNSTVSIVFPHQDDYKFENTDSKEIQRKIKIPVAVFNPNTPLTESTYEVNPEITITDASGKAFKVNCPSFNLEYPKLNITVTAPLPNEEGTIMAPKTNQVKITGNIDDPQAEVTVNDYVVQVYDGGYFEYDFQFKDDVTEDDEETIKIVATKNNSVTDEKEVTIHAYKFIPEQMQLSVNMTGNALRADTSGKLNVTGKTLPGATLTAVSDNSTNVLCGSVTVDGEGNFSFQVTTDPNFYGMSTITVNAVKEGATEGNTSFKILKGFKDKDAFLKYYNKTKTYLEITPKKTSIADLLANQTQYATNTYGFRITAVVVEVIDKDGDIIVKMTNNKTNETVYVHNLSEKWAPADNVGGKYNIYCNFIGTYEDTGCCEFLGWFAKKP